VKKIGKEKKKPQNNKTEKKINYKIISKRKKNIQNNLKMQEKNRNPVKLVLVCLGSMLFL